MIREAVKADVPAILEIYAPYVRNTTITFEYDVPTLDDFMSRFEKITQKYPWLVWEENGQILGYAYADAAFSRAAYAWDADLSIYLAENARGRGVGSKLYACLEALMTLYGYHNLYGIITGENTPSVHFHEKQGYLHLGTLIASGFKFDRWLDVYWYGKRLCEASAPQNAPKAFVWGTEERRILAQYA